MIANIYYIKDGKTITITHWEGVVDKFDDHRVWEFYTLNFPYFLGNQNEIRVYGKNRSFHIKKGMEYSCKDFGRIIAIMKKAGRRLTEIKRMVSFLRVCRNLGALGLFPKYRVGEVITSSDTREVK